MDTLWWCCVYVCASKAVEWIVKSKSHLLPNLVNNGRNQHQGSKGCLQILRKFTQKKSRKQKPHQDLRIKTIGPPTWYFLSIFGEQEELSALKWLILIYDARKEIHILNLIKWTKNHNLNKCFKVQASSLRRQSHRRHTNSGKRQTLWPIELS